MDPPALVTIPGLAASVWLHPLALDVAPDESARLATLLSAEERARAATYRRAVDRDRFVAGRGSVREVLAAHAGSRPERLAIAAGPHGKPRLAGPAALRFSVSHTGGRGLVAVTVGRELGVDLELVRPLGDPYGLARRVFTPAEAAAIGAASDAAEAVTAFHRCWVRKEACIKATGRGFHQPLDAFEVGVAPAAAPRTVALPAAGETAPRPWTLVDLDAGPDAHAALAIEDRRPR